MGWDWKLKLLDYIVVRIDIRINMEINSCLVASLLVDGVQFEEKFVVLDYIIDYQFNNRIGMEINSRLEESISLKSLTNLSFTERKYKI